MFLDYDQDTLDTLLNPRVPVPDFETYLSRFAERSDQARTRLSGDLDVRYGTSPRQRLDVFAAPTAAPGAMNVFFHGGYWRSSDKERYAFIAETFVAHGAGCALVEYDLTPNITMDGLVGQCREALRFLHGNASRWNIDTDRLFVSGHSAGGQIIGMLMAAGWHHEYAVPRDLIKGGCGISGLYELEPIRLSYLNGDVGLDSASVAANSPALHQPAGPGPLIAAVGDLEGREFFRQNRSIVDAWGSAITVEPLILERTNHFSAVEQLGDPTSPLAQRILSQMELT
jgi:arylformamidase